ncbi:hypothetical protein ASJ33_05460 [Dehalococcoides mccartyi]|uniref:helix-turn-helix domain-containing protein n=1 Tax=Dehalococcoides mccartyi TaxID=61435 RepID=UPI00090BA7B0|nr:helix-turn-helix domain-containing protein [Dehalococcoides mccartyi]APH12636.1 hypothetical protein ASJ33_05460 [Dehalococcoides mccartyi]
MTVETKRNYRKWTPEEELVLKEYDGSAKSAETLAKKLDVNPEWLRCKANRLLNAEVSGEKGTTDNPSLFTVDDICYALGVPEHKVNTWIATGALRKERVPGGFVVTRQELKRFFFKFTGELEGWQPKPEILKDIIQSEIKND